MKHALTRHSPLTVFLLAAAIVLLTVLFTAREFLDQRSVAVAARALSRGHVLERNDVVSKSRDRDDVPADAIPVRAVLNKRLLAEVEKEDILTRGNVGASVLPVPPGTRAVKLPLEETVVATETFVAGDHVDLLFAPRAEAGGQLSTPARVTDVPVLRAEGGGAPAYVVAIDVARLELVLQYLARSDLVITRSAA